MSYEWRSLAGVDTQAWSDLVRAIADADATAEYYSAEDLAEELTEDGVDLEHDTIAIYDGADLVGYGQVRLRAARAEDTARAILMGGIAPSHRGRGLGRDLLTRLEVAGRARAAQLQHDGALVFSAEAGSEATSALALLRHRGYEPARYFYGMERAVSPTDSDIVVDPRVRPYTAADDAEVRRVYGESFANHWSFSVPADGEWKAWYTGSRTFRPQHSFVAVDDDGIVAIVLTYQWEPHELWVGQVGVLDRARRQGLARALLTAVVASAATAPGVTEVGLGVDTQNADGAGALYARSGFAVARTTIAHRKPA